MLHRLKITYIKVLAIVQEPLKTSAEAIGSVSCEISLNLRRRIFIKVPDDPAKTIGQIKIYKLLLVLSMNCV